MMNDNSLKKELLGMCSELTNRRMNRIMGVIEDIETSLRSDSKNSSGDKYQTERAMLHIERENAGRQLQEIEKIKLQLKKVNVSIRSDHVRSGSLVTTNQGIFFISISVGVLKTGDTNYIGVAPNSPIGHLMLGKKAGDRFIFNQKEYFLLEVD